MNIETLIVLSRNKFGMLNKTFAIMEESVKMIREERKSRGTSLKASIKRKISSEEYVKTETKITGNFQDKN